MTVRFSRAHVSVYVRLFRNNGFAEFVYGNDGTVFKLAHDRYAPHRQACMHTHTHTPNLRVDAI